VVNLKPITTCTNCAAGPLTEIFSVNAVAQQVASATSPAAYPVPAGTSQTLNPGIYYGGICIGAPAGQSCGHNVGGSCNTAATAGGTVTMNPGTYVMAGGGFYVCGNARLIANGVTIYNTEDSQALTANAGKLDQVYLNTNGNVTLSGPGPEGGVLQGMTIWQGKDPASPAAGNLAVAPAGTKCDGRPLGTTDIAFVHTNNGLPGITGTIYAPNEWSLFNDSISGETTLAVITGCVFINGATSTFDFNPNLVTGISSGLVE
jgi:hypothetical protein